MMRAGILMVCGLMLGLVAGRAEAAEFTCPQASGTFAHPRDGTKFLECVQGVAHEKACTPGLVWDDLRKGCTSPGAVRKAPPKKPAAKKKKR